MLDGLTAPVHYSRPGVYRPPPPPYQRLQWLGPLLTAADLSPSYVVTLEVPGRRSGVIRRTSLVRVELGTDGYLVALAGESEWVRNVRAAGGRVVIGRRQRRAAALVELPPQDRPPVLRAYLFRAGRRPGSAQVAVEAQYFFGVSADPSVEELRAVADRYPVFRIVEEGRGSLEQPSGVPRRGLATGAGIVAVSAYAGAVGLATRTDPYLRQVYERLPFHSPTFGAVALVAVVAVPHTVVAQYAWRGDERTDAAAAIAGALLVGWLTVEDLVLRERTWLVPLYYGAGVLMILSGRRWLAATLRRSLNSEAGPGTP